MVYIHKQSETQFYPSEECILLGPWTSHSLLTDPKHLIFVLSRYKFCAKMIEGKKNIIEVGCGDAFGTPILAQAVEKVVAIDLDEIILEDNKKRLKKIKNIEFIKVNMCEKNIGDRIFDAAVSLDVIEHIPFSVEEKYITNMVKSLKKDGICIIGTPNITAKAYQSEWSKINHINLKSHYELKSLMQKYFENIFMFSMNDEVVHTGFGHMAHYLFAVGVGVKYDY